MRRGHAARASAGNSQGAIWRESTVARRPALIETNPCRYVGVPIRPGTGEVGAQIFGVLRGRPLLEGRNADADYLTRFVEAAVLLALGLR